MAKVFGVQLTKAELLARVGSIESLANVRRVTLEEAGDGICKPMR